MDSQAVIMAGGGSSTYPARPVTRCMTCASTMLRPLLDLGEQPLAERDDGNRYPLGLQDCGTCGLVQLTWAVDPEVVFPQDHPYASGNTAAMRRHFYGLATEAARLLGDGDLIIDIGSNDGTFLSAVRTVAPRARVRGVEPTGQGDAAEARGVPTEHGFFSWKLARAIVRAHGYPKVVTASNVLAHAADQDDFLSGVAVLCEDGATFITENHDAASVLGGLQIDTVYHEHLRYYTPPTLGYALGLHSMAVQRVEPVDTHGGSFRTWAVRYPGRGVAARAGVARGQLRDLMARIPDGEGLVWGIGAATRATTLIHWAGLDTWLAKVCEVTGSAKIGMNIPGTKIPVVDEAELIAAQPPYAVLLCWHIAGDVVPKLRAAGYEGRFIVPLPEPRVLDI